MWKKNLSQGKGLGRLTFTKQRLSPQGKNTERSECVSAQNETDVNQANRVEGGRGMESQALLGQSSPGQARPWELFC